MIMGEKIGVGIISCSRPIMFKKLYMSLKACEGIIDRLYVVEDTTRQKNTTSEYVSLPYTHESISDWKGYWGSLVAGHNQGVAKSKNKALKDLMDNECDHIFLIEDDMLIKDPTIFEKYIEASKVSGIQHFMFGYHGPANKGGVSGGVATPRLIVNYNDSVSIALNRHCVGAFCYYSNESLKRCGYIDETFRNAFDHVSHSYHLALRGFSTPYWWWSDLADSLDYIGEQECSSKSSSPRSEGYMNNFLNSKELFKNKFGVYPFGDNCVEDMTTPNIYKILKTMKVNRH